MPNPITLSSMAGIVIAGAGLGLYLGQSAISEIDPLYFSNPISTFHADLVASPADLDRAPRFEERLALATDLGTVCVGCRPYEAEYPEPDVPIDSYSNSYTSYRIVPAEIVMAEAEEFVAEAPSREDLEAVERYAYYRVSEEEPEEEPALAQAEVPEVIDASTCTADAACGGESRPAV